MLERSPSLANRDSLLAQAQQILRARLNLQGTTLGFSTERSDDWWWLMVSPDVNANRLLLAMRENPAWQADMGRLARGALGRQHKGRWDTTLANAWGTLALEKFSAKVRGAAGDRQQQRRAVRRGQARQLERRGAGQRAAGLAARAGPAHAAPRRRRQALGNRAKPGRRAA